MENGCSAAAFPTSSSPALEDACLPDPPKAERTISTDTQRSLPKKKPAFADGLLLTKVV
jgi:hypothetical protein